MKNRTARLQVRALDPWYTILRTRALAKGWWPRGTGSDFILGGTPTDRKDDTPRRVSAFLRAAGWKTVKTNHELRKYAGSHIIMRYGAYEAQTWLRHHSVQVTERYYARYTRTFRPADVTALPARWAVARQEFIPQILPAAAAAQ